MATHGFGRKIRQGLDITVGTDYIVTIGGSFKVRSTEGDGRTFEITDASSINAGGYELHNIGGLHASGITTLGSNVSIGGNMVLSGSTSLSGAVNAGSTFTVTGVTDLASHVSIGGALVADSTASIAGVANLGSSLNVAGVTDLAGNASIDGALVAGSSASIAGALNVTGNTAMTGNLDVAGITDLAGNASIDGAVVAGSTMYVAGVTNLASNATIAGNLVSSGTASIAGATDLAGNLDVGGTITAASDMTISGAIAVTGNAKLNNVTITSGVISGVSDPVDDDDAVNKSWVVNLVHGLKYTAPVDLAMTLYGDTRSGIQKFDASFGSTIIASKCTITGTVTGGAGYYVEDGFTLEGGDRVLFHQPGGSAISGIYTVNSVTGVSDTSSLYGFTRAIDFDEPEEIFNGIAALVTRGTFTGHSFVQSNDISAINTSVQLWNHFNMNAETQFVGDQFSLNALNRVFVKSLETEHSLEGISMAVGSKIHAHDISIGGALNVDETMRLTGVLTAESSASIAGVLDAATNVTIGGNLIAKGTASIAGVLDAASNATIGGNLIAEGTVSIAGVLDAASNVCRGQFRRRRNCVNYRCSRRSNERYYRGKSHNRRNCVNYRCSRRSV